MLRIAAIRLCNAGIVPIMLVHDAVLLEVDNLEQIKAAKEIMRGAGRDVCLGLDIGVDTDQTLAAGERYRDKREESKRLWATMMRTLEGARATATVTTAQRREVA
jgi:hypothetical protein